MAYYPTPLPRELEGIPARRPGVEPAKPPRVWKGVVTLVIMALLVGAVTGLGVLEADSLHSLPTSSGTAALTVNAGPSPATLPVSGSARGPTRI